MGKVKLVVQGIYGLVDGLAIFGKVYGFLTSNRGRFVALSAGLAAYSYYYSMRVAKRPRLICGDRTLRNFLEANLHSLHRRYHPSFWCLNSFAQTLISCLLRSTLKRLPYQRQMVPLPEGGLVSLDWVNLPLHKYFSDESERPVVLLVHAMKGDSQAGYIQSFLRVAHMLGYRACVFNERGRGGINLSTAGVNHQYNCDDFAVVVDALRQDYPTATIIATGFSSSTLQIVNYLCLFGDEARIDAAFCVSSLWDYFSLERTRLSRVINGLIVRDMVQMVRNNRDLLADNLDLNMNRICASKSIRKFDEEFTIKMSGIETVNHLYSEGNKLRDSLKNIKRPTFLLNSHDDFFAPCFTLPLEEIENSSHVAMMVTLRGGHVGFMQGFWPNLSFFSEKVFREYLQGYIDYQEQT